MFPSWLKDPPLDLPTNPSAAETRSCLVRVKLEYNFYSEHAYKSCNDSRRCWLIAALVYLHTIIATPDGWHLLPKFQAHLITDLGVLMEQMLKYPAGPCFDVGVHVWILIFGVVHARGEHVGWYRVALGMQGQKIRAVHLDQSKTLHSITKRAIKPSQIVLISVHSPTLGSLSESSYFPSSERY